MFYLYYSSQIFFQIYFQSALYYGLGFKGYGAKDLKNFGCEAGLNAGWDNRLWLASPNNHKYF